MAQEYCDHIELWERAVKYAEGCSTSRTQLKQLAIKFGIENITQVTVHQAKEFRTLAYQAYKASKPHRMAWQLNHVDLAQAKAKDNNTTLKKELKRI